MAIDNFEEQTELDTEFFNIELEKIKTVIVTVIDNSPLIFCFGAISFSPFFQTQSHTIYLATVT